MPGITKRFNLQHRNPFMKKRVNGMKRVVVGTVVGMLGFVIATCCANSEPDEVQVQGKVETQYLNVGVHKAEIAGGSIPSMLFYGGKATSGLCQAKYRLTAEEQNGLEYVGDIGAVVNELSYPEKELEANCCASGDPVYGYLTEEEQYFVVQHDGYYYVLM